MSSYGTEIPCPHCLVKHVIRVGEIGPERQIQFTCAACGEAVLINQFPPDEPLPPARAENQMGFKLKSVD